MSRAIVLLSIVAGAIGQDAFFEKYSFTKTMANCFGEDAYYKHLSKVGVAQRDCQQLPVSNLHRLDFSIYSPFGYPTTHFGDAQYVPFPNYHPGHGGQYLGGLPQGLQHFNFRKRRATIETNGSQNQPEPTPPMEPQGHQRKTPFFDRYYLLDSVNKIMAALSNYTCTLHKLGLVDEYLNLNVNNIITDYTRLPIHDQFKKDLVEGIFYCRDLTYCLPVEKMKSPLPLNLQRLLMAMKCEKETRTNACFKEDLRRNIHEFDLTLFSKEEKQEQKLNKLSAILMGVDSLGELEVL